MGFVRARNSAARTFAGTTGRSFRRFRWPRLCRSWQRLFGQDGWRPQCNGLVVGRWLQGDLIAEAGQPAEQAARYRGPVLPIEVVSTLLLVVLPLAQHLVSHD